MREDRLLQMERYIYDNTNVTTEDLCREFNISPNTARRDINDLVSRTNIRKVYGGVTAQSNQPNQLPAPFSIRLEDNTNAKETIGRLASSLVEDGDTIFVDAGTTACNMIDFLDGKSGITVITNSLEVVNRAVAHPEIDVIALPGQLDRHSLSFLDNSTVTILDNIHIDKAFMSTTGLSISNGATQPTVMGCTIKRTIIDHCSRVYLLTEVRKIGKISMLSYCPLSRVDTFVFEQAPPEEFLQACLSLGCKVIFP